MFTNIQQPNYISFYNKQMEGVDSLDSYVGCYRIDVHGKKLCLENNSCLKKILLK